MNRKRFRTRHCWVINKIDDHTKDVSEFVETIQQAEWFLAPDDCQQRANYTGKSKGIGSVSYAKSGVRRTSIDSVFGAALKNKSDVGDEMNQKTDADEVVFYYYTRSRNGHLN